MVTLETNRRRQCYEPTSIPSPVVGLCSIVLTTYAIQIAAGISCLSLLWQLPAASRNKRRPDLPACSAHERTGWPNSPGRSRRPGPPRAQTTLAPRDDPAPLLHPSYTADPGCSALAQRPALRRHETSRAAVASSFASPSPRSYISPRLFCALASPDRAATSNHFAASK